MRLSYILSGVTVVLVALLALSCNRVSQVDRVPIREKDSISPDNVEGRVTINLNIGLAAADGANSRVAATPAESQINRVTVITYRVPTMAAERSDPSKYYVSSFTDMYQDDLSNIAISVPSELFDIYVLVNLPENNLFAGNGDMYPDRLRFRQQDMVLQTTVAKLMTKRIHVRSQQPVHVDYNGMTMVGQLYSVDPSSTTSLTVGVHRLACKVNLTTVDNSNVLHYINAQSFLNIAIESPVVPPIPADRSAGALATYNAPSYCPDLEQTSFFGLSNLYAYTNQYEASVPMFSDPDANNRIPPKYSGVHVSEHYVNELRYGNESALNGRTCTTTHYLLQNRTAIYATRAVVRLHFANQAMGEDFMKYLSVKINDGTNGGGAGLVGRNRVFNVNMTLQPNVAKYVRNPWDYTYRTGVREQQDFLPLQSQGAQTAECEVSQSSGQW